MTADGRLDRAGGFLRENGLWLTALLVVAVFVGIAVVSDLGAVVDAASAVSSGTVLAVLALVTLSYGIRFLKWEYYLRVLDIDVPLRSSLLTFFSGLMLVVTPVKLGEAWKAWFLEAEEGAPAERTVAVVGAERVTDLLALTVLAGLGVLLYQRAVPVLVGVGVLGFLGVVVLQWEAGVTAFLGRLDGVPVVGGYVDELLVFYRDARALFRPVPVVVSMTLSVVAWGLEGVGLWLVLADLGASTGPVVAVSVFGLGSVVGAASMLPGGLAAAEASIAGVLVTLGVAKQTAIAATLVIRAATLWYGVVLGTAVFGSHRLARRQSTTETGSPE